jgi:signal transduction histidine kinase
VRLLPKLLLAYAVPTLVLFSLFAWLSWDLTRTDLDESLARRLGGVAAAASTQIRGRYLLDLEPEAEGGEPRAVLNTRRRLEAVRAATGVDRLSVFRLDTGASLCDTDPAVALGTPLHEVALDRHELGKVARGETTATVLYRRSDGQLSKAAYAPIWASDDDRTIVAALRVEAPAAFFGQLEELRDRLLGYGAVLVLVVGLASVVVALRITGPVRRLAKASAQLGRGQWDAELPSGGSDEIGALSGAFAEMRGALRQRDERLQMMLAGIAHEVRNPLGGMTLFAGLLREDLAGDPEKLGNVVKIERELGHLAAIVNDFLEYARRPPPVLEDVDLRALADDVAEVMAAGEALVVEGDGPVPARVDPRQLKRALGNLVKNALQATPAGKRVVLSVTRDRKLVVADTGPGIPAADLAKIFTPFFTTKEKGTGLGLAFVHEIVTAHGGMLHVDSGADRGTRITIQLP